MNAKLMKKLISKDVFNRVIEISAHYRAVDMSGMINFKSVGNFNLLRITEDHTNNRYILDVSDVDTGKHRRIINDAIVAIDGMDLDRFAAVYNLNVSGDALSSGRRRGRRPGRKKQLRAAKNG